MGYFLIPVIPLGAFPKKCVRLSHVNAIELRIIQFSPVSGAGHAERPQSISNDPQRF